MSKQEAERLLPKDNPQSFALFCHAILQAKLKQKIRGLNYSYELKHVPIYFSGTSISTCFNSFQKGSTVEIWQRSLVV